MAGSAHRHALGRCTAGTSTQYLTITSREPGRESQEQRAWLHPDRSTEGHFRQDGNNGLSCRSKEFDLLLPGSRPATIEVKRQIVRDKLRLASPNGVRSPRLCTARSQRLRVESRPTGGCRDPTGRLIIEDCASSAVRGGPFRSSGRPRSILITRIFHNVMDELP